MSTLLQKHCALLESENKTLRRDNARLKVSRDRYKAKADVLRETEKRCRSGKYSLEDVNKKINQYQQKNEELAKANAKLVSRNRDLSAKLRASKGGRA